MKRKIDKDLLSSYRNKPCLVCGSTNGTVAHHIKTVGSGGDDIPENLMCLCFKHHTEIHQIGLTASVIKYPKVRSWLEINKWKFDGFMQKYMRLTEKGWDE